MGSRRRSILVLLLLLLVCNMICGVVEGFQFTFNGFKSSDDLYIVPNNRVPADSGLLHDPTGGYYYLYPGTDSAGRMLFPGIVQVKDPANNLAVRSFSTTFVYQIYVENGSYDAGAGIAFIMVLDNSTLGDPQGYMGLMTIGPSTNNAHSFGVELDTYMDPEFNDTEYYHFGLDVGSMNSTRVFVPTDGFVMTTRNEALYQQVWIDYVAEDSRMDIYFGQYGPGKPDTPQAVWKSVDLSFMEENMFIGFSTAIGSNSRNAHKVVAWSFSNEGFAPPIYIAAQAPPPDASAPTSSPPPDASTPPPPPSASRPPPPPGASKPPPPSNPPPPPGNGSSPLGPGVVSGPSPKGKLSTGAIAGIVLGTLTGFIVCMIFLINMVYRALGLPLRLFLAHSAGKDGAGKNFAESLKKECLKKTWMYNLGLIKVFLDRSSLPKGKPFPAEIQRNLDKTQVGVVVITEAFFKRKWPMTELMSFVRSQRMNPNKVRILPLFFKMKIQEVKDKLAEGYWDEKWRQMSTPTHPIDVEVCRQAVTEMFTANGIEYPFHGEDRDVEYREIILKEIEKIWKQMVKERYSETVGKLWNRMLLRS